MGFNEFLYLMIGIGHLAACVIGVSMDVDYKRQELLENTFLNGKVHPTTGSPVGIN